MTENETEPVTLTFATTVSVDPNIGLWLMLGEEKEGCVYVCVCARKQQDLSSVLRYICFAIISGLLYLDLSCYLPSNYSLLLPVRHHNLMLRDSVVYFLPVTFISGNKGSIWVVSSVLMWTAGGGVGGGAGTGRGLFEEMLGYCRIKLQKINEGFVSQLSRLVFGWKVCIQFTVCKFILSINLGRKCFPSLRMLWKQSTCILLFSVNKICWLIRNSCLMWFIYLFLFSSHSARLLLLFGKTCRLLAARGPNNQPKTMRNSLIFLLLSQTKSLFIFYCLGKLSPNSFLSYTHIKATATKGS